MRRCFQVAIISKFLLAFTIAIAFSAMVGVTAARAEQITSFNSRLQVYADGRLGVTETIVYDPQGVAHHGILRDIVLKNSQGNRMQISGVSVADENGTPYKFTESGSDTVELKIGDPSVTFTEPKNYVIFYTVSGAYAYFDKFDEVYWNTTGNNWGFPIVTASAEVDLPAGVSSLQQSCYFGTYGSTNSCDSGSANSSVLNFSTPRALNPGEGMTLAVGFPKGVVVPTTGTNATSGGFLADYLWILILPIIPVLTFLILLGQWRKKWRSPKGAGVIIPQYDAPKGLTPIQIGAVLNEKMPNTAISAEIIYLATKGYVKIAETEKKVLLFTSKDYELHKIKELESSSDEQDKRIMSELFVASDTTLLSKLKNTFYVFIPAIRDATFNSLVLNGYFRQDPNKLKNRLKMAGTMIFIGSGILGVISAGILVPVIGPKSTLALFLGLAFSGFITVLFSLAVSVRTAEGVAAKEWILGFKEYLQIAEKDRINFANAPEKRPETFEKFLPYAIILGVEKAWAKEFEGIYTTPPSWYSGYPGTAFSTIAFTHSISLFSTASAASLGSSPRGSGSGGGGFSGGGGGGGGGGSW